MYEREHVTPELLDRHLRQLNDSLALIHRLANEVPYEPGDAWVAALPLDEARAANAAQALARAGVSDGKPSVLELYATHVNALISRVARPEEARPVSGASPALAVQPTTATPGSDGTASEGDAGLASDAGAPPAAPAQALPNGQVPSRPHYDSILAALGQADPRLVPLQQRYVQAQQQAEALARAEANLEAQRSGGASTSERMQSEASVKNLRAQFTQLKRELESAGASVADNPTARTIVQDATAVVSVAMRIAMEAASLATVVSAEAVALMGQSRRDWLRNAAGMASLAAAAPERVRALASQAQNDGDALKALLGALAKLQAIDPETTAGYLFKDGLVDDIVGFTWESIHVSADAGGDALFYNALANAEKSSGQGNTYDYTGRTYKLAYHVDPIILASARFAASMDWTKLPRALGLKLGYATNRVYKSGGELTNTTLSNALGVSNNFSDILDAALYMAGFTATAKVAKFTSGTVDLVQVADGAVILQAPFMFEMKEVDAGYDFAPSGQSLLQSASVTLGYFDYTLPRVLYQLDNATPGASNATFIYTRESPPQAVRTRYGMLGASIRAEQPLSYGFSTFLNTKGAIGLGPSDYYFLKDTTQPDIESNRDYSHHVSVGANFGGALGVRWRFTSSDSRFNAHLDALYGGQFIFSNLTANANKDQMVTSGSNDVFHGPSASVGGSF